MINLLQVFQMNILSCKIAHFCLQDLSISILTYEQKKSKPSVTDGYIYTIKAAANETADNILASHIHIR